MVGAESWPVSAIVFAVVVLATSLALVAGLAWASRRLLGLPVGALRALIAGLLGFAAAYFLGRALQAAQPGHLAAFITVALGVPLVVAMIFLVVAEAYSTRSSGTANRQPISQLHEEGHGPVVDQADLHVSTEDAGLDAGAQGPQRGDHGVNEWFGDRPRSGALPAGTASLTGVGVERELADDQQRRARV